MKACRRKKTIAEGMTTIGLLAALAVFENGLKRGETCWIPAIAEIKEELARRPGPKPTLKGLIASRLRGQP